MADPIEAYLAKHRIAEMLNGIVNELVVSKTEEPIDFLINGLLKEATARHLKPALVQRLQEVRQNIVDDKKKVSDLSDENKKLEAEVDQLKYNVVHLRKAMDELEKWGGGGRGGGGGVAVSSVTAGVAVPSGLIGVPPGHTPFSWAGGIASGNGGGNSSDSTTSVPASVELRSEPFSDRISVATLLKASEAAQGKSVLVCGWVRTNRPSKKLCFMSINDGSTNTNLQLVFEKDKLPTEQWEAAKSCSNGSAVRIEGNLKLSPAAGQKWELPVESIVITGPSDAAKYPIPPQKINLETLRGITHMRTRTGVMGAVFRVRNALAYATHTFFQKAGFMYIHAPLITGADCEGAGEMFQVTTLDLSKPVPKANGGVDYMQDFFGKPAYLTVSGQLNGEYCACAFGSIYTFGPTFRAENSNTTRHLAEFWMIEPEIAFCDLTLNMNCAEGYLRHCFKYVLENCADDLAFLEEYEEKRKEESGEVCARQSVLHTHSLTYVGGVRRRLCLPRRCLPIPPAAHALAASLAQRPTSCPPQGPCPSSISIHLHLPLVRALGLRTERWRG